MCLNKETYLEFLRTRNTNNKDFEFSNVCKEEQELVEKSVKQVFQIYLKKRVMEMKITF